MAASFADPPKVRSKLSAGSGGVTTLPLKFASGHTPQPIKSQGQAPKSVSEALAATAFVFDEHSRRLYGASGYYAVVEIDPSKNTVFTVSFGAGETAPGAPHAVVIDPHYKPSATAAAAAAPGTAIPSLYYDAGSAVRYLKGGSLAGTKPVPDHVTDFDQKFVLSFPVPAGGTAALSAAAKADIAAAEKSAGFITTSFGLTAVGDAVYTVADQHDTNGGGCQNLKLVKLTGGKPVLTKSGGVKSGAVPAVVIGGSGLISAAASDSKHVQTVPALSVKYSGVYIHSIVTDAVSPSSTLWLSGYKIGDWNQDDTPNTALPFIDRYVRPFSSAEIMSVLSSLKSIGAAGQFTELIAAYASGSGDGDGYITRYPLYHGAKPSHVLSTPSGLVIFSCAATSSLYTLCSSSGQIECLGGPNAYHPGGSGSDQQPKDSADLFAPGVSIEVSGPLTLDRKEQALFYVHLGSNILRRIKLSPKFFDH